jgi:hypothetical protein
MMPTSTGLNSRRRASSADRHAPILRGGNAGEAARFNNSQAAANRRLFASSVHRNEMRRSTATIAASSPAVAARALLYIAVGGRSETC